LVLLFNQAVPVHATAFQSIVVIDTGTNTSLFKDSIIYEVCIVSSFTCPNGKKVMEGSGAANLPATQSKYMDHGTQMISVVTQVNPSAKIIPIRIVGMSNKGVPSNYYQDDINAALKWVVKNYKKFNIAAVSISQGSVDKRCTAPKSIKETIAKLKEKNIPVLTAVGNSGSKKHVWNPSCLPDTVSVGATDLTYADGTPAIASYSNGTGKLTDFYLDPRYTTLSLDGSKSITIGTSNATAALASWWVLNKKETFNKTFAYLMSTSIITHNSWTTGRFIKIS
jgi:hypothetical protein